MNSPQLDELCRRVAEQHIPVFTHSGEVQAGSVFVIMPSSLPRGRENSMPGGEQYLA